MMFYFDECSNGETKQIILNSFLELSEYLKKHKDNIKKRIESIDFWKELLKKSHQPVSAIKDIIKLFPQSKAIIAELVTSKKCIQILYSAFNIERKFLHKTKPGLTGIVQLAYLLSNKVDKIANSLAQINTLSKKEVIEACEKYISVMKSIDKNNNKKDLKNDYSSDSDDNYSDSDYNYKRYSY